MRIATRGSKSGQCNICGEVGPLTEDHTPPKGCVRPRQVELQSLLRRLSDTQLGPKSRFSQNGVKYRTLCHRCNNTILGARYDPALIDFVNRVSVVLRSQLALPRELALGGRPQAISRAVIGHLSAQGVDRYRKGPLTEAVRDYFLDPSLPLPEPLRVFYWAYPHQSQVLVRDAAYIHIGEGKPFALWFMKFFPVAFMVTWDDVGRLPYPVSSFDAWRMAEVEAETELPLSLHPLPPDHWPEAPTDHSVLAFGQQAINVKANSGWPLIS